MKTTRQPSRVQKLKMRLTGIIATLMSSVWLIGHGTPAPAVEKRPVYAPWIRLQNDLNHLRLSPKGRYLAFTDGLEKGLRILDLSSGQVYAVTEERVEGSYVWAPDGSRLIYRELAALTGPPRNGLVAGISVPEGAGDAAIPRLRSSIKAYDAFLHKSMLIDDIGQATGLLTFDPRDMKIQALAEKSIISHQIILPDSRMAKWQKAATPEQGKWLATPKAILWAGLGGRSLDPMPDDGSGIESFGISPDGQSVAWATRKNLVYSSRTGEKPKLIGPGRDPSWHPEKSILVYAAARRVGVTTTDYDLRMIDQEGLAKWVTSTQHSKERWPQWMPSGSQILYTKDRTTDLYIMDFQL